VDLVPKELFELPRDETLEFPGEAERTRLVFPNSSPAFQSTPRRDPQGQLAVAILYFRMTWIAVMAPGGRKSRLILNSNTDEELKRGYGSSSIFKIRATWENCRKVLSVQTSP